MADTKNYLIKYLNEEAPSRQFKFVLLDWVCMISDSIGVFVSDKGEIIPISVNLLKIADPREDKRFYYIDLVSAINQTTQTLAINKQSCTLASEAELAGIVAMHEKLCCISEGGEIPPPDISCPCIDEQSPAPPDSWQVGFGATSILWSEEWFPTNFVPVVKTESGFWVWTSIITVEARLTGNAFRLTSTVDMQNGIGSTYDDTRPEVDIWPGVSEFEYEHKLVNRFFIRANDVVTRCEFDLSFIGIGIGTAPTFPSTINVTHQLCWEPLSEWLTQINPPN